MATILVSEAAALIGCSPRTVQRLCDKHGIGEKRGRIRLLTKADVNRLKSLYQGRIGNPKMLKGGESAAELGKKGATKRWGEK